MAGYYDEITGEYIDTGDTGVVNNPLDNTSGTNNIGNYDYDPVSNMWTTPTGEVVDLGYLSNTQTPFDTSGLSYLNSQPGLLSSVSKFFQKPGGGYDYGKMAALGTGLASMTSLNKAGKTPVGYQGGIPKYNAVQQQIPMQADPNRRPGSSGQRYFTDMQYATPENIAAKQGIVSQQAQTLAPAAPNSIAQETPIKGTPGYDAFIANGGVPMATGGLTALASGKYLRGHTDGMADEIPAQIGKDQPAKLSHGEFVIPADVVSHLGNGNSDAGANVLYAMMAKVRKARTGTDKQGKKINPEKFTPGGGIKGFAVGGSTGVTGVGSAASSGVAGTESNLSNWAGPYVTDMLGKGQALSETPYQAYTGPLTAGASDLQTQSFGNAANLNVPTGMGGYTPGTFDTTQANKYMNPYLSAALNPVLDEQRRQAEIDRVNESARYTKAGSYGGGRQAIADTENLRNLGNLQNKTLTEGYKTAYDKAMGQFNTEQGLGLQAQDLTNKYGLGAIEEQAKLGTTQRGIESEGIAADKAQFEEERADPFKKVQFQQSLLQGLPTTAQSYTPAQTSALQDLMSTGAMSTALYKQLQDLGVIAKDPTAPAATPTAKA
jgi:hypothetical protein